MGDIESGARAGREQDCTAPLTQPSSLKASAPVATNGSLGDIGTRILYWAKQTGAAGLVYAASSERRAVQAHRLLHDLAPEITVLLFPPWDCLPYDRAAPSRRVMGRRIATLKALTEPSDVPRIVVTTAAALLQRLPPRETWTTAQRRLRKGEPLTLPDLEKDLLRFGYVLDERIDEAGEAAIRGQVIDLFPAGWSEPARIEHADDRVVAIHQFDPATQLTTRELDEIVLLPTSEWLPPDDAQDSDRPLGIEHWLPEAYPTLETLFDYLPDAPLVLDPRADDRVETAFAQVADAFESRTRLRPERNGRRPLEPQRLYLSHEEWSRYLGGRTATRLALDPNRGSDIPNFAAEPRPFQKLGAFLRAEMDAGRRAVLAAAAEDDLRLITRNLARSLGVNPTRAETWADVEAAPPESILALRAEVETGFRDPESGITLIAAPDVLGSRARAGSAERRQVPAIAATEIEFRIGDLVIHSDHGLGQLAGIESLETDGIVSDLIRLTYADNDTLMVPVEEMDRIWRYGAAAEGVSLDRLDTESWAKRKRKVEEEVRRTAAHLVTLMRERRTASAPKLVPPRRTYERFVAGFPFPETADQVSAIEETLEDLASGHPMNRLVCGDVGFGKTEIALRAAAAAALAGKQVAVVAPTTVLVRQHVQTFRRRFAGLGIKIAHLSRLVKPAEAREVKKRLAQGEIRVVIGTHALAGKGVRFNDLGLVVIDEEQRFGAAHKEKLRTLGRDAHVLTLTATPIPRTLQAALVGLQEMSIIATPPARRQPIRTFVVPFDEATVREALMRENRRGGQSFVVCPRIEDIAPMAETLARLVPELKTFVAHGKMPPEAIDDVMVRFADGEGDVLLATNIIESGLDVPRANTMLVWHADRFGLAQLHQLRGRVGRGQLRGIAYLLTDPQQKLARSTRKRLETLESLDRLGAGFAISARDLDQRGAGDLLGEEQAGHVKLIGIELYQHLLHRAVAASEGEPPDDDWTPEINVGSSGFVPAEYVPEPEVRINLYSRFAKAASDEEIEAFEDEIENRFGPLPDPVRQLLTAARLRQQCRDLGVSRIDAGPQALALSFRNEAKSRDRIRRAIRRAEGALAWRDGRLVWPKPSRDEAERLSLLRKLLRFLAKDRRSV
jgi:transcription-repair coupling factor (superfamily II helicase)